MIRFVEMECPNCGAELKKSGKNTCKCTYCNATFLIDKEKKVVEKTVPVVQPAAQTGNKSLIIFVILIIAGLLGFYMIQSYREMMENEAVKKVQQIEAKQLVFSDMFEKFVLSAYGKPTAQLTEDDFGKLEMIKVNRAWEWMEIEYRMQGQDSQVLHWDKDECGPFQLEDLNYFTHLKVLDLSGVHNIDVPLTNLTELTELYCSNSPEHLLSLIPCPQNLSLLMCDCDTENLSGIEKYTGLKTLIVKNNDLISVDAISNMTNIETLELHTDGVAGFGALATLTNLKSLTIEAELLKEVSFLNSIHGLEYFNLIDTIVIDISPIVSHPNLKEVIFSRNDEIADYGPLGELENLERVSLSIESKNGMPDVSKWKKLDTLTISGIKDISFLSQLETLTCLNISSSSVEDFSPILNLPNLKELAVRSHYGDIRSITVLQKQESIEKLDLSGDKIYENLEGLFAMANLKELNINDISMGLNPDKIPGSETLEVLHMNNVRFFDNIQYVSDGFVSMIDYDKVEITDYQAFFEHFPNLKELYIQGNTVSNIEFVSALPNLKKLDITANYVTDIRPVGTLSKFETLWCGENPINQGQELKDRIEIDFNTTQTEKSIY